ncbi:probable cation transporter HKT7 isoform X2 [Brachypodium distachyon]|uniref:Uncharacterized protein n=1 Tax=Brachypodium distachyon TaxID=15368 RepID=I1J1J8_BRADI|nr:probable cation transporter HKT7 isoform X2 [Brachypodium distachyon]KQJ84462.1 hypothetical protein BRADI_5g21030v3 [Brachypodium distachyon]|eukprot:XP_010227256.2 probable cation transporter HKT7 isoform X2 [Brachypodium distachyon]
MAEAHPRRVLSTSSSALELHKAMLSAMSSLVTDRVARLRRALRTPLRLGSLLLHAAYFLAVSFLGYLILRTLSFRVSRRPRGIDVFFTAVSAATVSSMSTVEMEAFSNSQLIVITFLMFLGGEVFVSLAGLASQWHSLRKDATHKSQRVESHAELEMPISATTVDLEDDNNDNRNTSSPTMDAKKRRLGAVRALFWVVLSVLLSAHVLGAVTVAAYVARGAAATRRTLREKALNVWTFAAFATASTFSSCGYLPTNENMIPFKRDVGLQLLLIPQALLGNTLFPPLLWACVRALAAALMPMPMLADMARHGSRELTGYCHLLPAKRCAMLAATVAALVAVQVALVCGMEWGGALAGMGPWEKMVNAAFLAVNSRHTGESTIDLSTLAPAVLVLFVLMMYLPPYTTWFPFEETSSTKDHHPKQSQLGIKLIKSTVLSQLSYLTIFVIAICITEARKLKEDPLNFNVLSIVVEVVSAYGNVGFSMGYSCSRQINPDQLCTDRWTGLAGRCSDSGKLILILVMFFGRLKKFSMKGGKAWKLS